MQKAGSLIMTGCGSNKLPHTIPSIWLVRLAKTFTQSEQSSNVASILHKIHTNASNLQEEELQIETRL